MSEVAEAEEAAGGALTFMMGNFAATFPVDRVYATNHMWALPLGVGRWRFGLTAYAIRLLQDVYFLDWVLEAPCLVTSRQAIGSIESKKAESDLFAPLAGTIEQFATEALADPSVINVDGYGAGWLFEMAGEGTALLTPEGYLQHLEQAWVVAQRTIKGQVQ